jgi:hypothetical protein
MILVSTAEKPLATKTVSRCPWPEGAGDCRSEKQPVDHLQQQLLARAPGPYSPCVRRFKEQDKDDTAPASSYRGTVDPRFRRREGRRRGPKMSISMTDITALAAVQRLESSNTL